MSVWAWILLGPWIAFLALMGLAWGFTMLILLPLSILRDVITGKEREEIVN